MNLRSILKNAFRKIVGWALIILSAFSFIALFIPLARGDFGTFATGLLFSLFVLVLGWSVQTSLEKPRKRIIALFGRYFPRCPICKSDKGYEARGFLPSSQYVRCKSCEAEWTSTDFIGFRDLKSLKLWKPPENPQMYAEFISQSPLKLKKTYPTKLWQALMNKEEISLNMEKLPLFTKIKTIRPNDFVSSNKRCFIISLGASVVLTATGFYWFTVSKENAYILFLTVFFAIFVLLIEIRKL